MSEFRQALELWGGLECTVNRVNDTFLDQATQSLHEVREGDLERFASLGIRALRYPVLWEKVGPCETGECDWAQSDRSLSQLRELGVRPIVGLVHHGSGPAHTSLIDPEFPELLAEYAAKVARRYPWVTEFTPVNEPLTTARFAGMYGHWYPHGRDLRTFLQCLLIECRATVLAMRAIQEVTPGARLVQTEDLGRTYATEPLQYQADHENERRWLSFDLLTGRIDERHPMWILFKKAGLTEEAAWFAENHRAPDVVGINHYVTSERFLDHRLDRYPAHTHGGNGKDAYVDVEAVRVRARGIGGFEAALRETWERYGLPIAVTEAHLACTREEQARWFVQAWQSAERVREEGADVRAVTAWSLLGSFDWHCLLTRCEGYYEPGIFDLRGPEPRETAMAPILRELAAGQHAVRPYLAQPGWWERAIRLEYSPVDDRNPLSSPSRNSGSDPTRPILITGATGTLGKAFARLCALRGLPFRLLSRREMDIADPESVVAALRANRPWLVVNTAGYVRVDDAEADEPACVRENVSGAVCLAEGCAALGVPMIGFSSDLVFDGQADRPYAESDPTRPLNVYGATKAAMEGQVLAAHPDSLVIRTSAFFGPWDAHNFLHHALQALEQGRTFEAMEDVVVSPTYVPDLVNASLDLVIDGARGIWHLANQGAVTWAEFARMGATVAGLDPGGIVGRSMESLGLAAPRPAYAALDSERGRVMPTLESALGRFFVQREVEAPERVAAYAA